MTTKSVLKKILVAGSAVLIPLAGYSEFKIPEPSVLPDSLITVSIPDLHQTLDAVQVLADQILPEEANVQIKAQIGQMLGDPELKGFPAGSGAAMVWKGPIAFGVLECRPESAGKIAGICAGMQLLTAVQGDLLIVAKDPAGLEAGTAQAAAAVDTLLNQPLTGVVVNLQSAKIVETFRPQINTGMMMMGNMMAMNAGQMPEAQAKNMQGMARFVEGEMRVLVSLASQMENTELRILPKKDALEYAVGFSALEGSNLHALVTAPDTLSPDPLITAGNLQPGMLALEMFVGNPEAVMTFMKAESGQLIKEMSLDPEKAAKWQETLELWPLFFSGSVAETIDMNPEKGISMEYIASVQDPEEFLSALQSTTGLMKPLMKIYADMGMPMEMYLNMNARKSGGASVHQYNFKYDLENMNAMTANQLRSMHMDEMQSELTILDNRLLWSMGEGSLDNLLQRMKKGVISENSLHAHKIYPETGFLYYDMDMGKYFAYINGMMPEMAEIPQFKVFQTMAESLKDQPPLSGAAFQQENRVYISSSVPAAFLREVVQMGYMGHSPVRNPEPAPDRMQ